MKKLAIYILSISLLVSANVKPAEALVLDPAALTAKISDWVGKINDAVTKVTQQISQIKQMAAQGFSKEDLFGAFGEFLGKVGEDLMRKHRERVAKSTKEKEKENLANEQEQYLESSEKYYETKQKVVEENLKEANTLKSKTDQEMKSKEKEVENKESQYASLVKEKAKDEKINKAFDEWQVAKMELEELQQKASELKEKVDELNKEEEKIAKEASKIGTEDDPEYQAYQERLNAMDASEDKEVDVDASKEELEEQWDTDGILEKMTVSNDTYKAFIDKYFYNEQNISKGDNLLVASQTETDRVMRDRKQLLINTSTHLLQVTASLRREIPERSQRVKEMFEGVISTDSEFQAIGYYSSTRIENARALLMYAKLLSAKLQYMAAKDLLVIDAHRTSMSGEDFSRFNLAKYKLTDAYVKTIQEQSNKSVNLHEVSGEK